MYMYVPLSVLLSVYLCISLLLGCLFVDFTRCGMTLVAPATATATAAADADAASSSNFISFWLSQVQLQANALVVVVVVGCTFMVAF